MVSGFASSRVLGFAGSRVCRFAGSRVRGFAGSLVRALGVVVLLPVVLLASPSSSDTAHTPISGVVGRIGFLGNRHTREATIRREMTFHEGDSVTHDDLDESQERIYNTGLFNTVDLVASADTATGRLEVWVIVSERWYIWPQVILGVKDRDWKHMFSHGSKVYGGLGVVHFNVRGRREKLFVGGVLGYDPWAQLEYSFLALDSAQNWMFDGALATSRTLNQSDTLYTHGFGFNEIRYDASVFITRRLSKRVTTGVRAGIQTLHLSNPDARLTLNPSGTDLTPYFGIEALYDSRDDAEYALNGAWIYAFVRKYGAGSYINYERYFLDARAYHALGFVTVAMRAMTNLASGGNVPVYDHVFLGLGDRIRGEFDVKREGDDVAFGSVEARFPILRHGRVHWDAPGWVPSEFTAAQFTIALAVFADAGMTWWRTDRLADQRVSNGVGTGIHVVFPYGTVLRLEYAFHGTTPKGQFIFDLATSF